MEEKAFVVHIHGIQIIDSLMIAIPNNNYSGEGFAFDLSGKANVIVGEKLIVVTIKANIKELDNELVLGSITIAIGFNVEGFNEHISVITETKEITYKVDEGLELELRKVSVHTLRGLMFACFKGTYLHKAILPIIKF